MGNKYDIIGKFSQGVAIVVKDNKYGVVLQGGYEIIPPSYQYISEFNEGYAIGIINNLCHTINLSGKICIKLEMGYVEIPNDYSDAKYYNGDYIAVCKDGKWGVIDLSGKEIISPKYEYIANISNGIIIYRETRKDDFGHNKFYFGFVNPGVFESEPLYDSLSIDSDGNIINQIIVNSTYYNDKLRLYSQPRLFDKKGSLLAKKQNSYIKLRNKYDYVRDYHENIAIVRKGDLWGGINSFEKVVIPFEFDILLDFSDSTTLGLKRGEICFVHGNGNVVRSGMNAKKIIDVKKQYAIYSYDKYSRDKYSQYETVNSLFGIIDIRENKVYDIDSDAIYFPTEACPYFLIKKRFRYGLFDTQKGKVLDTKYDKILSVEGDYATVSFGSEYTGVRMVKLCGNSCVQNNDQLFELPSKYLFGKDFVKGMAPVYIDSAPYGKKWGIIDTNGSELTSATYQNIDMLECGLARTYEKIGVCKPRFGLYSKVIGELIKPTYYHIESAGDFLIASKYDGDDTYSYGLLDIQGRVKISFKYKKIEYKYEKFFLYEHNCIRYTDSNANILGEIPADNIGAICGNDCLSFSKNGKWGIYNLLSNSIVVSPCSYSELTNIKKGIYGATIENIPVMVNKDGRQLIKSRGKYLVIPDFLRYVKDFVGNYALAKIKTYYWEVYIDEKFNVYQKVDNKFVKIPNDITSISIEESVGLLIYKQESKWGIILGNNRIDISHTYKSLNYIGGNEGLYFIAEDKKGKGIYILKESNFEQVIPCIYEDVYPIRKDSETQLLKSGRNIFLKTDKICAFIVKIKGCYGVYSVKNEEILPCQYSNIYVRDLFYIIEQNNLKGLSNLKGRIITNPLYNDVDVLKNCDNKYFKIFCGNAKTSTLCSTSARHEGKWGIIDSNGDIVVPMLFDDIFSFDGRFVTAYINDSQQPSWMNIRYKILTNTNGDFVIPSSIEDDGNNYICISKEKYDVVYEDGGHVYAKWRTHTRELSEDGNLLISCGYKEVELPSKYKWGEDFENGYAKVYIDDKIGVIGTNLDEIVNPIYDSIEIESNDNIILFSCKLGDDCFVIDENGIVLYKMVYGKKISKNSSNCNMIYSDDSYYCKDWENIGAYIARRNTNCGYAPKLGFVDKWGNVIIDFVYPSLRNSKGYLVAKDDESVWHVFNTLGVELHSFDNCESVEVIDANIFVIDCNNVVFAGHDDCDDVYVYTKYSVDLIETSFENGVLKVCVDTGKWETHYNQDGEIEAEDIKLYGIFDIKGKELLPISFRKIGNFKNGLAIIKRNKYSGVINENYEFVVPCYHEDITYFDNCNVFVSNYGCLTTNGEHIRYINNETYLFDKKYRRIFDFYNNIAISEIVINNKSRFGLIDIDGNTLLSNIYGRMLRLENGMYKCSLNGKYGVLDSQGKYIHKHEFLSVGNFDNNHLVFTRSLDGTYSKDSAKCYGIMDMKCNIKLDYCSYLTIANENIRIFRKNEKFGLYYCDTHKIRIVDKASFIGKFYEGLAKINIGGVLQNKRVEGGLWGFISHEGDIVISPIFDSVDVFSEGLVAVRLNGKWGFANNQGKILVECNYDCMENKFTNGKGKLRSDDIIYTFNSNGDLIDECKADDEEDEGFNSHDFGASYDDDDYQYIRRQLIDSGRWDPDD